MQTSARISREVIERFSSAKNKGKITSHFVLPIMIPEVESTEMNCCLCSQCGNKKKQEKTRTLYV